jgi:hypothetical protein
MLLISEFGAGPFNRYGVHAPLSSEKGRVFGLEFA